MHPYSGKLKELNRVPLDTICDSKIEMRRFEDEDQEVVVLYVLRTLAKFFGGFYHFWNSDNDKEMILEGWKLGINDLSPRQIFAGLYEIVCGETQFIDYPPRSVLAFKNICLHSRIHYSITDKDLLLEAQRPVYSPEVAKSNIDKLKAILSSGRS
jgi:hypothetical protein